MKKITKTEVLISKLLVAGVFAATSMSAVADANLNVSANVLSTCLFSSANYTLDFGDLDPAEVLPDVLAEVEVSYWCTSGMTTTLQAGMGMNEANGTRNMQGFGNELIPYTLTLPAGGVITSGPGTPIVANVQGAIAYADYKDKHFGAYTDVVTLTLGLE